jgi:hypothetical protein
MTDDQIRTILVAIAEVRADVRQLADENDKADDLHDRMDRRITVLERAMWAIGGAALASAGGWAAVASKVLGG